MSLNLDEIEKAIGEATPGPWSRDFDELTEEEMIKPTGFTGYGKSAANCYNDAHLIAHAPEWLRLLVERVEKIESVAREVWDNASGDVTGKMIVKGSAMMKLLDILDDAKEST